MSEFRSEIFEYADAIVERYAALDPLFATEAGVTGYDECLPDFSPEGTAAQLAAVREMCDHLATLSASDDIDRISLSVTRERLETSRELLETGESERLFSVIHSPLSSVRQTFELMAADTEADLEVIATRLEAVGPSLASWRRRLEDLARTDRLASRRHVVGVAEQAATYATGTFARFAERVAPNSSSDERLQRAAKNADDACAELATWMHEELVPQANERDYCGVERYRVWAKDYMGAELDFDELYEWGWSDLCRIHARMWEIAPQLVAGASSLVEVAEFLDHDPSRQIVGTDALLHRLISFTEAATAKLDGVHFDIDPRVRFCDARLAPEGGAAAPYYYGPSEDLSRPGTTWYPTLGETTFSWWENASTWYHEGVPGHHLQVSSTIIAADRLSRFHRLAAWTSGHGEGWALYAERLCEELGFFEDLGEEMGYLASQALRAARVVVDIGMHLQLAAPSDLGELGDLGDCSGRAWTPEMAVALLEEWAIQSRAMSESEVERYLGMPAQAISYKVGERVWLRARAEARERLGEDFSLKRFHAYALNLGPMGLDALESELRDWQGE